MLCQSFSVYSGSRPSGTCISARPTIQGNVRAPVALKCVRERILTEKVVTSRMEAVQLVSLDPLLICPHLTQDYFASYHSRS